MTEQAYQRYQAIQAAIQSDEEYRVLEERCIALLPMWQTVLSGLPPEQQEVLTDFIGCCSELSDRALELACYIGCSKNTEYGNHAIPHP